MLIAIPRAQSDIFQISSFVKQQSPKDSQFSVINDREKQQIFLLKKLVQANN